MITVYGYKKCGTCRKAEKFLIEQSLEYTFVDITLNPPSLRELKKIIKLSKKPIEKFYNTSGVKYKELDIKTKRKGLSEKEQLELLASDGYLLKRPQVTDGKSASVGFIQSEFEEIWSS